MTSEAKTPSEFRATVHTSLEPAAAATPPVAEALGPVLKLVVRGFLATERSLLEGVVRLSQRRSPRLELLKGPQIDQADIVMIDAADPEAVAWAQQEPGLGRKAVIWVDGGTAAPGHTLAQRPVQWPILPMLLARALEQGPRRGDSPSRRAAPTTSSSAAPRPAPSGGTPQRLLVVDDSLAVRAYLRSLLEAQGHVVAEADCVPAAIEALSSSLFACVLMDVLMPGVDGYEGCRQIKARLRGANDVPVIMLTSKASPFDRIRGKMAGCDAYLTKPVDPKELHGVIAQFLNPQSKSQSQPSAASARRTAVS
jgi:twitching motility two-component system response regulator PilG